MYAPCILHVNVHVRCICIAQAWLGDLVRLGYRFPAIVM